jgi:hypothetical protein
VLGSLVHGIAAATWRGGAIGLVAGAALLAGGAAPEPDPVPRRWQLDIETGPLRCAVVDVPGVGPRSYFYLTYRVTNNSGEDLLFAPSFELATQEEVLRSGRNVPLEVTRTLLQSCQNEFLQDQIGIIGQLLQGKENARDGIVIWPANDLNVEDVAIYAAGFSGETATVIAPDTKQKFILRKTLMLRYKVSGELNPRGAIPLAEPPRWIMR